MENNNFDAIKELLEKINANLAELTKITKDREARFVERSNKPSTGNRDFRSNRSFDDRRNSNWEDKKDFGNRRNNR